MKTFVNGKPKGMESFDEIEHKELLLLHEAGMSVVDLASRYRVSVPTIYAWLKRPIGYKFARGKKAPGRQPHEAGAHALGEDRDTQPEDTQQDGAA